MATDEINAVRDMLRERNFQSVEEINAFMRDQMNERNNAPVDEFLGISPARMNALLNNRIGDGNGPLAINNGIMASSLMNVPAIEQCRYLLGKIGGDDKGVKATQKGNFPSALVKEFYDLHIRENDYFDRKIKGEDDLKEVSRAKLFLRDSGFIKFRFGRYSVTKKGKAMMGDFDHNGFYMHLFDYFIRTHNWLYMTTYPDPMEFLQVAAPFSLFIIREKASGYTPGLSLAELYLKAFPSILDHIHGEYGRTIVLSGFEYLFLKGFAHYLGLVDMKMEEKRIFDRKVEYRTTDLFKEFLIWKI